MTQRWRIADNLAQVDSGHRVLVLVLDDPQQPNPHAFSSSGAEIWRTIDEASPGGIDAAGIVALLAEAFQMDAADIAGDVEQFVRTLSGMGLIVPADAASGGAASGGAASRGSASGGAASGGSTSGSAASDGSASGSES